MSRSCGTCNLCCKLLGIGEIKKRPNCWCPEVKLGKGCGIYDTRPAACREFACLWLLDPNFPDEYQPSKIHAFLANMESASPQGVEKPPGELVSIYVDPAYPLAHTEEPINGWAQTLVKKGYRVIAIVGEKAWGRMADGWMRCRTEKRGDVFEGVFDVFLE